MPQEQQSLGAVLDVPWAQARKFTATGAVSKYDIVEEAAAAPASAFPKAGRAAATTAVGTLWVALDVAPATGSVFRAVPYVVRHEMDTSSYSADDILYLGAAGALVASTAIPSGGKVRAVARVLVSSSTVGVLVYDPQGLVQSGTALLSSDSGGELTIASGAITVSGASRYTVDTESDAATDALDTVSGLIAGRFYLLSPANSARDVTLTSAGNIVLPEAAKQGLLPLNSTSDYALGYSDGTSLFIIAHRSTAYIGGGIYRATGTIAAGAVNTLNATPVELVAAPGAGKVIVPLGVLWALDYGGTQYVTAAAGETLQTKWENGSGVANTSPIPGNSFGGATADTLASGIGIAAVVAASGCVNKAIVAHINTAEWGDGTPGDSPVHYALRYYVEDDLLG